LKAVRYDPGFEPAIAAGLLSPYEAAQRGKRQELAERLSRRHGIPIEVALQVADNRIRLSQAQAFAKSRRRDPVELPKKKPARQAGFRGSRVWLVGAVLGVAGAAGLILSGVETPLTPAGRQRPGPLTQAVEPTLDPLPQTAPDAPGAPDVTVQRDALGNPTRISGRDPKSVLLAYCTAEPYYEPVGLLPHRSARPNLRLAVIRDTGDAGGSLRIVRVNRERDGRGWFAGDGREPIPVRDAPGDLDASSIRPIH
jgi:hypothetical protein